MNNRHESARRIAITGAGVVSPIGIGAEAFWKNLAAGKSGVGPLTSMSYSAAPRNVAAEIREFTESEARKSWLKDLRKSIKVMCREIQLGVASASLVLENAGIDLEKIDHSRIGVEFGANLMLSPPDVLKDACWICCDESSTGRQFQYERWGTTGLPSMEPLWLLRYLPNMPACHIGIAADARGPNNSITLAEASGNLVIGEASRIIARGSADVMIAGTTGTRVHPVKALQAALWDELAESDGPPETWCRPFDLHRTGQVLGEGACSFLLEEESHARGRGARILGFVLGSGSSCVIRGDGTPDRPKALVNAMRAALNDAGISAKDVGHINAHGLASPLADREEYLAIKEVFGPLAEKVPVTALKSYLGNSGSGCGTLELAGSLLALGQGIVPPTLNYQTVDPECPLNVVHGGPLPVSNKTVLKISVTSIGQASAVVARGE
ncbi:MAG: beta-ketoacyl-[acyl-carrier-protein] synthase family protein [Pirellulales bacterium]